MTDTNIRANIWSIWIIASTIEIDIDKGNYAQAKESAEKIRKICDALAEAVDPNWRMTQDVAEQAERVSELIEKYKEQDK